MSIFWQGVEEELPAGEAGAGDDASLVAALLEGNEPAFVHLLHRYHNSMLRLAMLYVRDQSVAEEVVQETWVGVLNGLGRFERRSSLKTWIFRILTNQARTRGKREAHTMPFSDLRDAGAESEPCSVDPARFRPSDDPNWPHHWTSLPHNWDAVPEDRLISLETRSHIDRAIASLPSNQRTIVTLRDVDGWTAEEVCNVLGITETNQRVLLHRARSRLRQSLEEYLKAD